MTERAFGGAFPHQHGDPRPLVARIEAQLRERLEEAVEMAGLTLMVEARQRFGRPAPETSSAADRKEFEETADALLTHLRQAFWGELTPEQRAGVDAAEAGASGRRQRLLAAQIFLARQLPDYWQRFESHAGAFSRSRLEGPAAAKSGWLNRLLKSE